MKSKKTKQKLSLSTVNSDSLPPETRDITPSISEFRPLALPSMFWKPEFIDAGMNFWVGHLPFAFWVVEALRPRCLVELGTHTGNSYFSFCQAVDRLGLICTCFAVDTWAGDQHTGAYGEEIFAEVHRHNAAHYAGFSTLVRSTFDEAQPHFEDGSIDLLHIDGTHTFEAVRHDFETWLPKLSQRAVVLLHDTNVRFGSFGVSRFFAKLKTEYPSFEFHHSNGLGIVGVGPEQPELLQNLFNIASSQGASGALHQVFARLGQACLDLGETKLLRIKAESLEGQIQEKRREIEKYSQELGMQRGTFAERVTTLVHEKTLLESEHGEVRAKLEALAQAHEQTQAKLTELETGKTALAAQHDALATEKQALDSRLSTLQAERDALLQDRSTLDSRLSTLVAERDARTKERDVLSSEKKVLDARLSTLDSEREALSTRLSTLVSEKDALATERDALSTERDVLSSEKKALDARLSTLTTERDSLSTRLSTLTAERDSLLQERSTLDSRLSTLVAERDALASQLATLGTERDELDKEFVSAQTNIHERFEELSVLTRRNMDLDTERNRLANTLDATTSLLSHTQTAYQNKCDEMADKFVEFEQKTAQFHSEIANLESQSRDTTSLLSHTQTAYQNKCDEMADKVAEFDQKMAQFHSEMASLNGHLQDKSRQLDQYIKESAQMARIIVDARKNIEAWTQTVGFVAQVGQILQGSSVEHGDHQHIHHELREISHLGRTFSSLDFRIVEHSGHAGVAIFEPPSGERPFYGWEKSGVEEGRGYLLIIPSETKGADWLVRATTNDLILFQNLVTHIMQHQLATRGQNKWFAVCQRILAEADDLPIRLHYDDVRLLSKQAGVQKVELVNPSRNGRVLAYDKISFKGKNLIRIESETVSLDCKSKNLTVPQKELRDLYLKEARNLFFHIQKAQ
jgi:uncharacterized coiled-coil DUF342 family protein